MWPKERCSYVLNTLVMYLIYPKSPYQLNKNATETRLTDTTDRTNACAPNTIATLKDPQG